MYEAGKNSFQMYHLDEVQRGLFKDSKFWPQLDGKSKFAVRWQDHAVLSDIDRFFYRHNYSYWHSYDKDESYTQSDGTVIYRYQLFRKFPFIYQPYYSHATKGLSYIGDADVSYDLTPGWFGADLLNHIETRLDKLLMKRDEFGYMNWRAWYSILPPQLGLHYPSDSDYYVNGLMYTLLSTLRWKYVARADKLFDLWDAIAWSYDSVIVRKGAAKLISSPVVLNSCVEKHKWSYSSSWADGNYEYNTVEDNPTFNYSPSKGYEWDDDDPPTNTKKFFQKILGCSFSDLSLKLNGLKVFNKAYNDEFFGVGLRAPIVEAAYEMAETLCNADALYLGNSMTTAKYSYSDDKMKDGKTADLPLSHPKKFYSGGYESRADSASSTGAWKSEYDHGPRNNHFSVRGLKRKGLSDDNFGTTNIFDGNYAGVRVNISWAGYTSSRRDVYSDSGHDYSGSSKTLRKYNSLGYNGSKTAQTSEGQMKTPDFSSHLYFGFGMSIAYTKEDGGTTVSSCKAIVPVSITVNEYRYRYSYYNNVPPPRDSDDEDDSPRYDSGRSESEYERTITRGTVLIPLSLVPFASKRNRAEGTSQLWESKESASDIINKALSALSVKWAFPDLKQRSKTDLEKPTRAWDIPSPGGDSTSGDSVYELYATVSLSSSQGIIDDRNPAGLVYYYPKYGSAILHAAVVSWTPEFKSKVFGG